MTWIKLPTCLEADVKQNLHTFSEKKKDSVCKIFVKGD